MPARLYELLRTTRLCLFDGGRSGPHCEICRHDSARVRAALCVSHQKFAAAACATPAAMSLFARWRMFHSCGEAGAVQAVPVLAGAGGWKVCQARVEKDGGVVSRDRPGRIGAD